MEFKPEDFWTLACSVSDFTIEQPVYNTRDSVTEIVPLNELSDYLIAKGEEREIYNILLNGGENKNRIAQEIEDKQISKYGENNFKIRID